MARQKPSLATRRQPSDLHAQSNGVIHSNAYNQNGTVKRNEKQTESNGELKGPQAQLQESLSQPGLVELLVCVGGIYASFLSWALLQERITTTPYGPTAHRFTYSIFLNTIQSSFAALTGYIYLRLSSRNSASGTTPPIFPSRAILPPLALVAITSSLASPFGYASLKHIDYITFILAKSCKLLPVMFLHISLFQRKYPLYKYLVVALVTLGVAVFTLHHPASSSSHGKKAGKGGNPSSSSSSSSSAWGLLLLSINLLFDGLTNSTQDWIFAAFRPFSGPQMMCAQNAMSTALTGAYLLAAPYVAPTAAGAWLGMGSGRELAEALEFVGRYPRVGWDVLAFAGCGAVGQVFIFYTLAHFSSLLLVTVTVTRKMLTMILSVLWFGHRISGMQWVGVGLVFGGIGAEGLIQKREKDAKRKKKPEAVEARGKKEL